MFNRVKISITGKNTNYFFKELIKRNINIYNLEKESNTIKIIVDYKDYLDILEIKTTYKIKVIEEYGLCKYKSLLKKYMVFIIFSILAVIINIILSNIVFEIKINHPNKKLVKTIKEDLKELGLRKYRFKVSYKEKELIKTKLLEKEKDTLEWVEIEESGTKYIIKIEERKKNKKEESCNYRHIVAKKNAVITDIRATAGEIKRKKNDYVEKGEILISGFIYNKEDIVSKRCSIGEVFGEVWYKVSLSIPKNYTTEKLLNNKKYGISTKFLKKELNLLNSFRVFEKKEYNIIDSEIMSLSFGFAKFQEKKVDKINYTLKNVDEKALELAENKIKKNLEKDESIIGKKVLKKSENNSKINIEVFVKVKENITDYFDITDVNIEEMNEKEE